MKSAAKHGKLHWIWFAMAVIVFVMMTASMFHFRGFIAKTGNLYRKRIIFYMLPALIALVSSLYRPTWIKKHSGVLGIAFLALGIFAGAVAFQNITWGDSWDHIPKYYMDLSYAPLILSLTAVIFIAIWIFVWDLRWAVVISYWFLCLCGYAYQCLYLFRGIAFKPMDILSFGTALSVAGNYQYPFQVKHAFWLSVGFMLLVCSRSLGPLKAITWKKRLIKLTCVIVAGGWMGFLLMTPYIHTLNIVTTAFEDDAGYYNSKQGTLPTLLMETWNLRQNTPSNYDVQKLMEYNSCFMDDQMSNFVEEQPNVIVVVNESFADLGSLWQLDMNQDVLPFLHSLEEKTVYGQLYVSAFGGQTCNTNTVS